MTGKSIPKYGNIRVGRYSNSYFLKTFTKVTSPLGSVTSVVCGFESRRPHHLKATFLPLLKGWNVAFSVEKKGEEKYN